MDSLRVVKLHEISDELLEAFEEVQQNANQYVNASFEITTDEDVEYESFAELSV